MPRSLSALHGFLFHLLLIECQTEFYSQKTDQSEIGDERYFAFPAHNIAPNTAPVNEAVLTASLVSISESFNLEMLVSRAVMY